MDTFLFALPGNEQLASEMTAKGGYATGTAEIRWFPDGESYVRILTDVKGKKALVLCTLHLPDEQLLPLYFLVKTLQSLGASEVCLVAPYLAYMRQDKIFHPGEGVTSSYFAELVSGFADRLVTIDPHLHRHNSMAEIYTIPAIVKHAADDIARWIKDNIKDPLLIGPDGESEQWVSDVAGKAGAPYIVLTKIRTGDMDVEVSVPHVEQYQQRIPVLVDDIISTGRTMIETMEHLSKAGMQAPVCIGVHAVFAGDAYNQIMNAGARQVVTCNTIPHPSNAIDLSGLLCDGVESVFDVNI